MDATAAGQVDAASWRRPRNSAMCQPVRVAPMLVARAVAQRDRHDVVRARVTRRERRRAGPRRTRSSRRGRDARTTVKARGPAPGAPDGHRAPPRACVRRIDEHTDGRPVSDPSDSVEPNASPSVGRRRISVSVEEAKAVLDQALPVDVGALPRTSADERTVHVKRQVDLRRRSRRATSARPRCSPAWRRACARDVHPRAAPSTTRAPSRPRRAPRTRRAYRARAAASVRPRAARYARACCDTSAATGRRTTRCPRRRASGRGRGRARSSGGRDARARPRVAVVERGVERAVARGGESRAPVAQEHGRRRRRREREAATARRTAASAIRGPRASSDVAGVLRSASAVERARPVSLARRRPSYSVASAPAEPRVVRPPSESQLGQLREPPLAERHPYCESRRDGNVKSGKRGQERRRERLVESRDERASEGRTPAASASRHAVPEPAVREQVVVLALVPGAVDRAGRSSGAHTRPDGPSNAPAARARAEQARRREQRGVVPHLAIRQAFVVAGDQLRARRDHPLANRRAERRRATTRGSPVSSRSSATMSCSSQIDSRYVLKNDPRRPEHVVLVRVLRDTARRTARGRPARSRDGARRRAARTAPPRAPRARRARAGTP